MITLLLYQMVHHHTTLRGSGQWSTTIARITTNTHTTILTTKRGSSESCAIQDFLQVTLSTGKAGCRTVPYSTSSGTYSGSSSEKQLRMGWVRTYSASPATPTEGGYNRIICIDKSRIRLRFNLQKIDILCRGLFYRKPFRNQFLQ